MKKQIYEQSVQNARIDLNLATNRVKFDYPTRKLSRIRELFLVFPTIWIPYILLYFIIKFSYVLMVFDYSSIPGYIIEIAVWKILFVLLPVFAEMFLIPLIVSVVMIFSKRNLLRFFPKLNYVYARAFNFGSFYVARFENIKDKIVEIPLFNNVILNYKATGECGEYLKNINIREHPFMEVVTRIDGTKVKPNDTLWKAVFRFSKIPKTGMLEVYFL